MENQCYDELFAFPKDVNAFWITGNYGTGKSDTAYFIENFPPEDLNKLELED